MWIARCDCGKRIIIAPYNIASGKNISCGCANRSPAKDYTGMRRGKLTFIERVNKSIEYSRAAIWRAKCDCGEVIYAAPSHKWPNSCGCLVGDGLTNRKYTPVESSAAKIWRGKYSDGGLPFDVFVELTQQNCFYCGAPPKNSFNWGKCKPNASRFQIEYGDFIYNGLDRVDNNRAHTPDNVVPCCIICNRMKMKMELGVYEFLSHIERIAGKAKETKRKLNSLFKRRLLL